MYFFYLIPKEHSKISKKNWGLILILFTNSFFLSLSRKHVRKP